MYLLFIMENHILVLILAKLEIKEILVVLVIQRAKNCQERGVVWI